MLNNSSPPHRNQPFNEKDLTDESGSTAVRLYFNLSVSHSTIHKPNLSKIIYGTGGLGMKNRESQRSEGQMLLNRQGSGSQAQ